jgi:hypothetical protein
VHKHALSNARYSAEECTRQVALFPSVWTGCPWQAGAEIALYSISRHHLKCRLAVLFKEGTFSAMRYHGQGLRQPQDNDAREDAWRVYTEYDLDSDHVCRTSASKDGRIDA